AHLPEGVRLGAGPGGLVGEPVAPGPLEDDCPLLADLGRPARELEEEDRAARLALEDVPAGRSLRAVDRVPVEELADRGLDPEGEEGQGRPEGVGLRLERDKERPALGGERYQ